MDVEELEACRSTIVRKSELFVILHATLGMRAYG